MKDLVVLVADKDMEYALRGLLERPQDLGIQAIEYDLFVHPRHDPGCLRESQDFLRPWSKTYHCALVMFDREGCGQEQESPHELADRVKEQLERNGWSYCEAVVLAPELEVWVWSNSPHVEDCLGWANREPSLRAWLATNGHWPVDVPKPPQPKKVLEAALREVGKPRSSAIYLALAKSVSPRRHSEPSFLRFTQALQEWFPP